MFTRMMGCTINEDIGGRNLSVPLNYWHCCFTPLGMKLLYGDERDETEDNKILMSSGSDESIAEQGITENDAVIGLDDIILSEGTIKENEEQNSQDEEMKGVTTEITHTDNGQHAASSYIEPQEPTKETTETEADDEDEGIGLDGNELDDINRTKDLEEESSSAVNEKTAAIVEEGSCLNMCM